MIYLWIAVGIMLCGSDWDPAIKVVVSKPQVVKEYYEIDHVLDTLVVYERNKIYTLPSFCVNEMDSIKILVQKGRVEVNCYAWQEKITIYDTGDTTRSANCADIVLIYPQPRRVIEEFEIVKRLK